MSHPSAQSAPPTVDPRGGLTAVASAYLFWGFLPLYFMLVSFARPEEIIVWRVLWCAPILALFLIATKTWREAWRAVREPGALRTLALSAGFISLNWWLYVVAVHDHRVAEASLAYFMSPLVTTLVGVLVFHERLTRAQTLALCLAGIGVAGQTLALGAPPWLTLGLCVTWVAYAFIRRGTSISAAGGLFFETLLLTPLALCGLVVMAMLGQALTFDDSPLNAALLALGSPLTAAPLALFAFGLRRLRFSTLGLLQYIAPSVQFLIAVATGEAIDAARLASFALIWTALVIFSYDAIQRERRTR